VGSCFDNAAAEAFYSSLEWEVLFHNSLRDTNQARAVVIDRCYTFYNHQRRHSAADGVLTRQLRDQGTSQSRNRHRKPSTISGEHTAVVEIDDGISTGRYRLLVSVVVGACLTY
jgi:hypothetical protein